MPDELKSLRDRLDAVDRRIVEALAERQHVVGEVSRLKLASAPIRIRDVDREDALLTRIVGLAEQAGADPVLLTRLYRDILAASVHWQQQQVVARDNPHRPKRVAYQGRPGSYSHAAATRHFAGTPVTLEGHDSFRSMLDARPRDSTLPASRVSLPGTSSPLRPSVPRGARAEVPEKSIELGCVADNLGAL